MNVIGIPSYLKSEFYKSEKGAHLNFWDRGAKTFSLTPRFNEGNRRQFDSATVLTVSALVRRAGNS
jgi:hypothetical protein